MTKGKTKKIIIPEGCKNVLERNAQKEMRSLSNYCNTMLQEMKTAMEKDPELIDKLANITIKRGKTEEIYIRIPPELTTYYENLATEYAVTLSLLVARIILYSLKKKQ